MHGMVICPVRGRCPGGGKMSYSGGGSTGARLLLLLSVCRAAQRREHYAVVTQRTLTHCIIIFIFLHPR